jgi:hypothetical protein
MPRLAAFLPLALVAGCAADPEVARKVDRSFPTVPAAVPPPMLCPVSGEEVTAASPQAWFNVYPVYCRTDADRKQFAALKPGSRARAAAEQVLPQKRIANATCPMSDETLDAGAVPVLFEGEIYGFASRADANDFRALTAKPEKQRKIIADWKAASGESGTAAER